MLIAYLKGFLSVLFLLIGLGFIAVSVTLIGTNFKWIYVLNLGIGYLLARYGSQIPFFFDDYSLNKEIKRRQQIENIIKINGALIQVPANEITIDEKVEEAIIEKATGIFSLFSGIIHGIDRSRDVKDYKISSLLIYKTKIDGKNYNFISLPVNRRKESIFFILSNREYVDLYVDKTNKKIYYFDVEFLKTN
jgi:hypothetical protein